MLRLVALSGFKKLSLCRASWLGMLEAVEGALLYGSLSHFDTFIEALADTEE